MYTDNNMTSTNPKSQTLHYTLLSKNVLTTNETELYELCTLAGITLDPNVFKILIDLLRMNAAPTAIERMLKSIVTNKLGTVDNTSTSTLDSSSSSRRSHHKTR